MRVSFIGLGAIGYPMAGHLPKRHQTVVWNRTASRAQQHAKEHGSQMAKTLEETADAEIIFTCLPTSAEVAEIVDKLKPKLRRGALWVDCTSGDPTASREIASQLQTLGVAFLDAPVSGGVPGAINGQLTVMVGGDENALEQVRPALECFAAKIVRVGDVGAGHTVKAISNTLMAVNVWASSEGLVTLAQQGVDLSLALDAINASSGRSNATERLLPSPLLKREFPPRFKLALLAKDVKIATSLTRASGISSPVFALISELLNASKATLGTEADYLEIVKAIERWSGINDA
ncbi:NAD(P)-dependent oxidoreductase [Candidatus Acetothermia bacterium]|nr:NAD(P)-dependent oxidoreductase [Candidatus Acetothermia bacterium]